MNDILVIDQVSMHFSGLVALDKINIKVHEGEIFGVIGPNGAGKTTLYNIITGFNTPTEGSVKFKNKDIKGIPVDEINKLGITRTFQNIRVFGDLTVLENVLIGLHNDIHTNLLSVILKSKKSIIQEKQAKETAMELLDYMGIGHLADEYANSLPYGAQRKLEIARALAGNPSLILLDEPSAGMNEQETMALMELIKDINRKRGITIIVIEHNMNFIMNLCSRIAVLNFGKLMMIGEPHEVQSDPQVIEAYIGKVDKDE